MNPRLPRRFDALLLVFALRGRVLFGTTTRFFPERSIECISVDFVVTMGTYVLMCAIGRECTPRRIERCFSAPKTLR